MAGVEVMSLKKQKQKMEGKCSFRLDSVFDAILIAHVTNAEQQNAVRCPTNGEQKEARLFRFCLRGNM